MVKQASSTHFIISYGVKVLVFTVSGKCFVTFFTANLWIFIFIGYLRAYISFPSNVSPPSGNTLFFSRIIRQLRRYRGLQAVTHGYAPPAHFPHTLGSADSHGHGDMLYGGGHPLAIDSRGMAGDGH